MFDPIRYGVPAADPVHKINGAASPNIPPITVGEGQVVRLHIVNDTAEYHPMHLHGHTMSVLSRNGVPVDGSPLHCHVLLHAAFGMTMAVNCAGITTPYEMGARSGNLPEEGRALCSGGMDGGMASPEGLR